MSSYLFVVSSFKGDTDVTFSSLSLLYDSSLALASLLFMNWIVGHAQTLLVMLNEKPESLRFILSGPWMCESASVRNLFETGFTFYSQSKGNHQPHVLICVILTETSMFLHRCQRWCIFYISTYCRMWLLISRYQVIQALNTDLWTKCSGSVVVMQLLINTMTLNM